MMNQPSEADLAHKRGRRAISLSIAVYLLLSTAKILVGAYTESEALTADGMNNITDVGASIMLMIGMIISRKPADHNHQYGHVRAETAGALLAAFMMAAVGIEVVISAIGKLITPNTITAAPELLSTVVAIVSALILYILSRYNMKVADETSNLAVKAAAYDNRSDAIVSIGTLIGIAVAQLGWLWADAAMAVIVGIIILKTAYVLGKEAINRLMDGFEEDKRLEIKDRIMEIEGVRNVTELRARYQGSAVHVDCIIEVSPLLTVEESHDLTDEIEIHLEGFCGIERTLIHVEPAKRESIPV
ncbi:cation diffusion facilitator family transporter [Brevibacillus daliensis]|uniref:cation diffusion facilitator family transporter n=1 Tax=Brevibacillus daliensis TaxID=2892995 RepID=UPI001E634D49|nr:cation diffusion facilitator family transporter [Brevibacillus daliensis]